MVDEVDVADLIDEKKHGYVFPHPAGGFVDFRVLPDPERPEDDLFDAGRVIAPGQRETMRVTLPSGARRLVLRSPPEIKAKVDVRIDEQRAGQLVLEGVPDPKSPSKGPKLPRGAWVEVSLALPEGQAGNRTLSLVAVEGAFVDYHVWIVASGD